MLFQQNVERYAYNVLKVASMGACIVPEDTESGTMQFTVSVTEHCKISLTFWKWILKNLDWKIHVQHKNKNISSEIISIH